MSDPLIGRAALQVIEAELRDRLRAEDDLALDPEDAAYGEALRRVRLFERFIDLVERVAPGLSELDHWYNLYYWWERLVAQYTAKCGPDAGLEQQAFQHFETVDGDHVDPELMQELARRARED